MSHTTYRILTSESDPNKIEFEVQILDGKFEMVRTKLFDFDFSNLDKDGSFSFDYSYAENGSIVSDNLDEFTNTLDIIVNDILKAALEHATN
jgi:hypothetical protein